MMSKKVLLFFSSKDALSILSHVIGDTIQYLHFSIPDKVNNFTLIAFYFERRLCTETLIDFTILDPREKKISFSSNFTLIAFHFHFYFKRSFCLSSHRLCTVIQLTSQFLIHARK